MKAIDYYHPIEYTMTRAMANAILKNYRKDGNKQKNLCDCVNNEFRIKGNCVKVIIED